MGAAKKDNSISRAGFAERVSAKRFYGSFRILPSNIRADHHNDNHDRAALYSLAEHLPELAGHPSLAGDRICYTRAEVMARADSFKRVGQEQAIKVYRSNTHEADVGAGFLRHIAALFLEVTGGLADCPGMTDGLLCTAEEQPKDPLSAVDKNAAENERKDVTPIDRAWKCRRYEALGLTRPEIAAKIGCDKRTVDRLFQLLTLAPSVQLDVHEGRTTMMAAINDASAKGKGTARGANAGDLTRRQVRRRDPEKRPSEGLTAEQVDRLFDLFTGDMLAADVSDPTLQSWVRYAQSERARPPKEPKPPKTPKKPKPAKEPKPRKKTPPKPGNKQPEPQPEGAAQ